MKISPCHTDERRLEISLVAFFVLALCSLVGISLVDPSIYAHTLLLTSAQADRYPLVLTGVMCLLVVLVALLIFGVLHHWRWLFWLILLAFGASVLRVPIALLQFAGIVPATGPFWYSLLQTGVAVVEAGLAIEMIRIYRRQGVWALGKPGDGRCVEPE